MTGQLIVKLGMLLAGLLFLFAAIKPAITGGTLNVTFFIIGIACALIGVVLLRKPAGPGGSAGA